jgi:hypothetical protein
MGGECYSWVGIRLQFQEVTLEVEITRLEPDGHSSLRLHGLVFEEVLSLQRLLAFCA